MKERTYPCHQNPIRIPIIVLFLNLLVPDNPQYDLNNLLAGRLYHASEQSDQKKLIDYSKATENGAQVLLNYIPPSHCARRSAFWCSWLAQQVCSGCTLFP